MKGSKTKFAHSATRILCAIPNECEALDSLPYIGLQMCFVSMLFKEPHLIPSMLSGTTAIMNCHEQYMCPCVDHLIIMFVLHMSSVCNAFLVTWVDRDNINSVLPGQCFSLYCIKSLKLLKTIS